MLSLNTPNKSLYKIVNKVNYSILAGWTLELVGRVVTGFLGGSTETEMGREIIHWKSYDLIRVDC